MGEEKQKPKKKDTTNTRTVWFSLKKTLHCKSDASTDGHNPKTRRQLTSILTKKAPRSGCSRSLANLKDVIHGSKRQHLTASERPPTSCSPRSIGSSDFLNPIAHEVILSNSKCELRITGCNGLLHESGGGGDNSCVVDGVSTYDVGTLMPGTPMHSYYSNTNNCNNSPFKNWAASTPPRKKSSSVLGERSNGVFALEKKGSSFGKDGNGVVACHKCGEQFVKWEALESHHLSKHAVTELMEGDSSRKIVEIICRSSWLKSENQCVRIDRVLKVHSMQKTLARFEEYRETVKSKASKLPKKHPRCLADGNELLRFYGTTLTCSLGLNGYNSSLCVFEKCCVCRIIRQGFSTKRELKDGIGVFTTSTSGRAFESIEIYENDLSTRKALIVCRVIAGRVHRPLENVRDVVGQSGFDSLAGKVGLYSNIEELYLLNAKALLPCFVVICKS